MPGVERHIRDPAARLLAAIVSSSNDAIIGKSVNGVITSWNAGAERIFGYSAAEVIGRPISILAPPERDDEMPQLLDRIRRGERIDHFETTRRHKNGSLVIVSLTVSPILDETGAVIGASKVARDITAARKSAEALARAEERLDAQTRELIHAARLAELGQLAAMLAHEVNQPLTATLAYLQGAQAFLKASGKSALENVAEGLNGAERQARRAADIVQRMKSFANPGAGVLEPDIVDDAVRDAVSVAMLDAKQRGVTVDVTGSSEDTLVLMDRVEIEQLVINLLRNAFDAMDAQPEKCVEVSVRRLLNEVEVSVRDNGPGIASEIKDKLFSPFVSTKSTGLGLGLSICQKIIARHDGSLWAEAASPTGAEFSFRLPIWNERTAPHLVLLKGGA